MNEQASSVTYCSGCGVYTSSPHEAFQIDVEGTVMSWGVCSTGLAANVAEGIRHSPWNKVTVHGLGIKPLSTRRWIAENTPTSADRPPSGTP